MGKFDYRAAAAKINRVRWETNYPSKEDAYWAYQNAIRGMMRDIANYLQDNIEEHHSNDCVRIETEKTIVFVILDRIIIRCDWVGYGLSDEMFEIYIADSKDSADDYCTSFKNNPDVFPSEKTCACVGYDATPEDVMEFIDIVTGETKEIKERLTEFYKRRNIHSRMKSNDPSLIQLWIDVVYGMIEIPA